MVNIENIIKLIEWRDEVNEKRKARAIQRVIDRLVSKLDKKGVRFQGGGFASSEYSSLKMKCFVRRLKIDAW